MAQLVKCLTSAQVMILRFMSSSPALGSVLIAQSLEPASDSVSPSLSAPLLLTLCLSVCLSLSLSKINIKKAAEIPHSSGDWKSGTKAPANLVPDESSLPTLQKADFLLCPHLAFPLCVYVERDLSLPRLYFFKMFIYF